MDTPVMQQPIENPGPVWPPFAPLRLSPYHYVPVLQDRSGEREALLHVRQAAVQRVTPLMVVVGPRLRIPPTATMLAGRARALSESLGERPFFVDLLRLQPLARVSGRGNTTTLEYLYERLRTRYAAFVPVLALASRPRERAVVRAALGEDHRGVAIRVNLGSGVMRNPRELDIALQTCAQELGAFPDEIDVLMDVGFLDPDAEVDSGWVRDQVAHTGSAAPWRSLVLIGTSMPATLGMINENSMGAIRRHEWELWTRIVAEIGPAVDYGDYAIQHPTPPQDSGPGMRANIRYTLPNRTVLVRGEGPVTQGIGSLQYQDLALQLMALDDFSTRDFSWGDEVIESCASGSVPRSSQHTWRGAGTSHHIEVVCGQLSAATRT